MILCLINAIAYLQEQYRISLFLTVMFTMVIAKHSPWELAFLSYMISLSLNVIVSKFNKMIFYLLNAIACLEKEYGIPFFFTAVFRRAIALD